MPTRSRILVVDDEPRLVRLLVQTLEDEGYVVTSAGSGEEMRASLEQETPDLILLDVRLPDSDGFSLTREIREKSDVGVILLTGRTEEVDKIVGLELGADDYVTKPFSNRELIARVRSVLRRTESAPRSTKTDEQGVIEFEGWTLDIVGHELRNPDGEPIQMTSFEFRLLAALVERANRVLSRDQLLDLIADRNSAGPFDRSVDVLIGKVRKKVEDDPQNPRFIKTIRGAGYKFTCRTIRR